jgi:hypothetical protein
LPAALRPCRPLPWHAEIVALVHDEPPRDGAPAQNEPVYYDAPVHAE